MVMFRSETMTHGTLVLPLDRCRDFIELLGTQAHIEFVDMNAGSMQRTYRKYIQRIDEMERILRFLFEEIKRMPGTTIVEGDAESFLALPPEQNYQLEQVERALQKLHAQFLKFRENNDDLRAQRDASREHYAVCRAAMNSLSATESGRTMEGGHMVGFSNLAGVLASEDRHRFARTIFRATRGNAFTYFESLDEESENGEVTGVTDKVVFVVYFQQTAVGQSAIREKLERICGAFGVSIYDWPRSASEAREQLNELANVIADKTKALTAFEEFFVNETSALLEVHRVDGGSLIEDYRLFCLREKAIYATLNMFEASDVTLRADCWFPTAEEEKIRQLLMSRSTASQVSAFLLTDNVSKKAKNPPTYIRTTDFTEVFQSFVDTYGVPRYKEANPALLTIVTFPFLFGIMYGDIGHGLCVLAFGIFLVVAWPKLKRIDDEMVQMIAGGRYMILLMGCFAVYAGFLYNDFFSLGLNLFGSAYLPGETDPVSEKTTWHMRDDRGPYVLGVDPVWKGAENELLFTNSFKMKFAVLVGFVQMTVGIILKGMNCIFFKDYLSFIFEFIPQLLFMLSLVGFMDLLIIVKWATPWKLDFWEGEDNRPSVINTIIEMCMLSKPEKILFKGQPTLMKVCIFLMVITIPIMLLPKPFLLKAQHKKARKTLGNDASGHAGHTALGNSDQADFDAADLMEAGGQSAAHHHEDEEEEEFDFGETMIHQMIETIEFVLGAISNTASYLRLWALSLAHQQLSAVFFQMTIEKILVMDLSPVLLGILLFITFAIFAGITFGIMLCMDTLECFLHALRLQWVEFQNKFFKADGRSFVPFSFKRALLNKDV